MNRYWVRTEVRILGSFTEETDLVPADPTTVTLLIQNPSHVVQTVSPVRDGVGQYHYDVTLDASGIWTYQWQGDGELIAASPVGLMQVF